MRHAFVTKQAMIALIMLSFKLNIIYKNFEPNWENFQRYPGDGVENHCPLGPTQNWSPTAQVPSLWQTCLGEKYN